MQRIADGPDGLAFQVVGLAVQLPKLLKGVDAHGLPAVHHPGGNDHAALILQGLLPEYAVIPRLRVHCLQPGADGVGIRLRQIADADHRIPAAALGHGHQLPLAADTDTAVVVGPVRDHVPGVELLPGKGVAAAPAVAGDHIGVCQVLPGQVQGVEVVLRRVFGVDDQLHAVGVHQVFVLLLHESHDHIDLPDAGLLQLADQALDEHLAVDLQQALGYLRVQGDHPHAGPGRQDDRPPRLSDLKFCRRFLRDTEVVVYITGLAQGLQGAVHHAQGMARLLCQKALRREPAALQLYQNIVFRYVHDLHTSFFREHCSADLPACQESPARICRMPLCYFHPPAPCGAGP